MEISNNPAYEGNTEDSQISGDHFCNHAVLPASNKNHNGGATDSCKVRLFIVIALYTAVLALVVAVVSVGLSTTFISQLESASLQVSLNQSVNTFEGDLGQHISAHQPPHESISSLQLSLNQVVNTIEDLGRQISALQTTTATQYGFLNQRVNSIQDTVREHSDILNNLISNSSMTNPAIATSCSDIPTDNRSGEYWIVGNSSSVQVYCDMNRTCCNTTGGWMRVANLDMTDFNQQCPDGFLLHNETTAPLRTCGRPGPPGCVSTTFPVHGIEYSRVCGRVIGYQSGTSDAFAAYFSNRTLTINDYYVDGVSLTHGQSPRKHIWTFACARDEVDANANTCPCSRSASTYTGAVPPFIGQDYFCDTGNRNSRQFTIYPDDPLWNGEGCGGNSTCCSFNNPPWFCKQLPQPTTDDIELRLCLNQATSDEDFLLELVDIFVK